MIEMKSIKRKRLCELFLLNIYKYMFVFVGHTNEMHFRFHIQSWGLGRVELEYLEGSRKEGKRVHEGL